MPRLVDTTIRVLSQEPLAGLMPTAEVLRLAELLDRAGFAYLEVSGGGRHEALVDAAKRLPELGAARILLNDPAAVLQPHRASELVAELRDVSGLPVGLYAQGAGGNALAAALEAARAGADVIAVAVYPVALTMHRVAAEAAVQALGGLGPD